MWIHVGDVAGEVSEEHQTGSLILSKGMYIDVSSWMNRDLLDHRAVCLPSLSVRGLK